MSASVIDMLPSVDESPAASVPSVKCPVPSFTNSELGPPSAFTSRSRSPSPSTSANTAPVEKRPAAATPASAAISSNLQPPRLRQSSFGPSMPAR